MVACRTTSPWMWAMRAICGYVGLGAFSFNPSTTPDETRNFCGVACLGGGVEEPIRPPMTPPAEPPGTPPTTPPTTPVLGAGDSSSLIICIFLGILLGVRSAPSTISLTFCTCWICGAAGGGGGGGGGGATRNVVNVPLGSASVKINGSKTKKPTRESCTKVETNPVHFWLVLILPPDSIRLSSNMPLLLGELLKLYGHRDRSICSRKPGEFSAYTNFFDLYFDPNLTFVACALTLGWQHRCTRSRAPRPPIRICH